MIVINGSARVSPANRDALVAALDTVTESTRTDAGCILYYFAADLHDPDVILNVEIWDSQEALDAHLSHEHTHAFLGSVGGLVEDEPQMTIRDTAGIQ